MAARRIALALLIAASPVLGSCAQLAAQLRDAGGQLTPSGADIGERVGPGMQKIGSGFAKLVHTLSSPANKAFGPKQAYYVGRTVTATILAEKYDNRLVGIVGTGTSAKPTRAMAYVDRIASVIAAAAARTEPKGLHERHPATLRVGIVRSDIPNAYSSPGGFTIVTTGMLALTHSEDELAAVLAHEMGHVVLGHGLAAIDAGRRRAAIREIGAGVAQSAQSLGLHNEKLAKDLAGVSDDIAKKLETGYDPAWEFQADHRGAQILAAAGYDPSALVRVIRRLEKWHEAHPEVHCLATTHPPAADRIAHLGKLTASPVPAKAVAVREHRFESEMRRLGRRHHGRRTAAR